jgi:hypothetical protein
MPWRYVYTIRYEERVGVDDDENGDDENGDDVVVVVVLRLMLIGEL